MNKQQIFFINFFFFIAAAKAKQTNEIIEVHDRFVLDQIVAVVKWERTAVFTQSDIEKPSLFGKQGSLNDLITTELVDQDATERHKIVIDGDVIDKYLGSIQRSNKFTDQQMQAVYESAGITEVEARRQLRMMYAQNMMIDHKITSRLVIPEKDIIAHYEAHPIMKEAKYQLSTIFIPFAKDKEQEEQEQEIEQMIATGKIALSRWSTPFWLKESEIAAEKRFIVHMNPGDISKPQEVADGFILYKLIEKKPEYAVPLHKRYREIADELRRPKLTELMESYTKSLWNSASVIYYT